MKAYDRPIRPEGPPERFGVRAASSQYYGRVWQVFDRGTNSVVTTMPTRFVAEESARLCALNLNRGHLHVRYARVAASGSEA